MDKKTRRPVPPAPFVTPEGAQISALAQIQWQAIRERLGVPVLVNEEKDGGSGSHGPYNEEQGKNILASLAANAEKAPPKPSVLALMNAHGAVMGVLQIAKGHGVKTTVFADLIKKGAFDPRRQILLDALIIERARSTQRNDSSKKWSWDIAEMPEANAWARLFTGARSPVSGSEGRDILRRWLPAIAKLHPKATPALVRDTVKLALESSRAPLPKVSSPVDLTEEQAKLKRMVEHCAQLIAWAEKALKAAGASVETATLTPQSFTDIKAAFDAKSQRMAEKKEYAAAEQDKQAAPEELASDSPWSEELAEGRRKMAFAAAESLDPAALRWIAEQSADGGAWLGEPQFGSLMLSRVNVALNDVARTAGSNQKQSIASAQAAAVFGFLIEKGLDLMQEARASHFGTDNPFVRLAHLCSSDSSGVFTSRVMAESARQMRVAEIDLADAEAWAKEGERQINAVLGPNQQKSPFADMLRGTLERWQINAELERVSETPRGAPEESPEANAQTARKRARL